MADAAARHNDAADLPPAGRDDDADCGEAGQHPGMAQWGSRRRGRTESRTTGRRSASRWPWASSWFGGRHGRRCGRRRRGIDGWRDGPASATSPSPAARRGPPTPAALEAARGGDGEAERAQGPSRCRLDAVSGTEASARGRSDAQRARPPRVTQVPPDTNSTRPNPDWPPRLRARSSRDRQGGHQQRSGEFGHRSSQPRASVPNVAPRDEVVDPPARPTCRTS